MARKRSTSKGRRDRPRFIGFTLPFIEHKNFSLLSHRAVRMIISLRAQYNGYNNGDLVATLSVMKKYGWNSNDQIKKAIDELLDQDFVVLTRQGSRPKNPNLYAMTWEAIDECGGKLEIGSTHKAPNNWKLKINS